MKKITLFFTALFLVCSSLPAQLVPGTSAYNAVTSKNLSPQNGNGSLGNIYNSAFSAITSSISNVVLTNPNGVNDLENGPFFSIHPNPSNGVFTLNFTDEA